SPTSSLPAVVPAPASLSSVPADRLPPRKRERMDEHEEARARAVEQIDVFSQDMISYLEDGLGHAEHLIQEQAVASVTDGLRIRRIERHLGM
ncbi:hypothetical protein Tco_1171759, partial [Tanacetum coccineum]